MSDKKLGIFKNLSKCEVCGNIYSNREYTACPVCSGINFKNISSVKIIDRQTAYQTKEVFDCDFVSTNFLSDLDGFNHYEGEWEEQEVKFGKDITFKLTYCDGDSETLTFHSSLPVCRRLIRLSKTKSK